MLNNLILLIQVPQTLHQKQFLIVQINVRKPSTQIQLDEIMIDWI